ncbi:hypothetical protein Tco_0309373 [Tanacetum coccineum]
MEILLEPTSNKLMVDSILQAGNPVKEILLKLNLPDHRSILTDSKEYIKMDMEIFYNKDEAKAALLKAQPSFPNVEQLKELLVKSLKTKLSNILSTYDFSSLLPTELKDIPSKLNELTGEVHGLKNQVHTLEIKLLGELKEIPIKLENFTKTVTRLLSHFTKVLNKFAQVLVSTSSKAGDKSVPSAGQADTMPAEGEKNTNQATMQSEKTTPPLIPPIITTTTQMQSPLP